ncbi:hypothetical protein [Klebsiella pneumoniae]|uniref:hypothetical protein n=1 Tax=Klebsiella pneumoniae TaxID=573 RepID=UPI000F534894|nr:hypothetical protein [Klebsiella pneumoniae]QAT11962.1 hypothetical protein CAK82_27475 [Klebsiella pneumoniae]
MLLILVQKCFEPIPDNVKCMIGGLLIWFLFGEIVYLDEPLIKYRQHSNNTIGAPVLSPLDIAFGD